eukprot:9127665-Alexandrium_andersonii.AAC.1
MSRRSARARVRACWPSGARPLSVCAGAGAGGAEPRDSEGACRRGCPQRSRRRGRSPGGARRRR